MFTYDSDRNNEYDGVREYWVKVRETGQRLEKQSKEENHRKVTKARTLLKSPALS